MELRARKVLKEQPERKARRVRPERQVLPDLKVPPDRRDLKARKV